MTTRKSKNDSKEWNKISDKNPPKNKVLLLWDGKNVQRGERRNDDIYLWFGDRWKKNMLKISHWKVLNINTPK